MSDLPHSPLDATPGDIAGRMAGEYRLGRKLGEGGFGAVYEAEHPVLKRRAAVKVLHQVAGVDSDAVLRFISEAQAANQVRSRHIVDVFSFGKLSNGRHFYVMDLLDGDPLDRYLRRQQRVDVSTTLQLLRPIAEALDAAHAAGVVHRDLKPQNIFLAWEPSGETVPKLLDFGMAKLLGDSAVHTVSGVPIGTPLYMSPEQARGEKVDGRSDVYALGVVCHEMLTGQVPFTGESPLAVLMCHLTVVPPRASDVCPDVPAALDAPILHMLHKEPSGRPATAGEAMKALIAAAESAGIVVPGGMPHLPRPVSAPVPRASFSPGMDTSAGMRTPVGSSAPAQPSDTQRAAMLGRTDRASGGRTSWGLWALLAIIAGGFAYLGVNASSGRGDAAKGNGAEAPAARAPSAPSLPEAAAAAPTAPLAAAVPARSVAAAGSGSSLAGSEPIAGDVPASHSSPERVRLTLRGAPPGARVAVDGKLLGDAASDLSLPYGDAPLEVTISAAGHEAQTLRVTPREDLSLEVRLKRRAAASKPRGNIPSDLENPF